MTADISKPKPPHTGCRYDGYDQYYCEACEWQQLDDYRRQMEYHAKKVAFEAAAKEVARSLKAPTLMHLNRVRGFKALAGKLAALKFAYEETGDEKLQAWLEKAFRQPNAG